jgi:YHS domain-containing protein
MPRLTAYLFAIALLAPLSACKKGDASAETNSPTDAHAHQGEHEHHGDKHGDVEGEVVKNWEAKPGDVTVCPMSGEKFEVAESSPRFDYQGQSFVFCCPHCLEKVEAEPGKYLDPLIEEAGGGAATEAPEAEG